MSRTSHCRQLEANQSSLAARLLPARARAARWRAWGPSSATRPRCGTSRRRQVRQLQKRRARAANTVACVADVRRPPTGAGVQAGRKRRSWRSSWRSGSSESGAGCRSWTLAFCRASSSSSSTGRRSGCSGSSRLQVRSARGTALQGATSNARLTAAPARNASFHGTAHRRGRSAQGQRSKAGRRRDTQERPHHQLRRCAALRLYIAPVLACRSRLLTCDGQAPPTKRRWS